LSIEPLLGEVTFDLSGVQWVILGAETGTNPSIPEQKWIDGIIEQTKRLNVPLFMKGNIKAYSTTFMQEFPK
jgi:protein gp37